MAKNDKLLMNQIADKFFENKQPSPPILFITYGPPASGKTTILNTLIKSFNISKDRLIEIVVDEIVERIPEYQESIMKLKEETHLTNDERADKSKEIYFDFRERYADGISDKILSRALIQKFHIIFETTGGDISYTLKVIYEARQNGYLIVLIYPLVELAELKKRVEKRNETSLRFISPSFVESVAKKAQINFQKIIKYVDKAFVYDNAENNVSIFFSEQIVYGSCKISANNNNSTNKRKFIFCNDGIEKTIECPNKQRLGEFKKESEKQFLDYINFTCQDLIQEN